MSIIIRCLSHRNISALTCSEQSGAYIRDDYLTCEYAPFLSRTCRMRENRKHVAALVKLAQPHTHGTVWLFKEEGLYFLKCFNMVWSFIFSCIAPLRNIPQRAHGNYAARRLPLYTSPLRVRKHTRTFYRF